MLKFFTANHGMSLSLSENDDQREGRDSTDEPKREGVDVRTKSLITGIILAALSVSGAYSQTPSELVFPAGMFSKDWEGVVRESGGYAGTGVQHGTLRFPPDQGPRVVGITTLLPSSWVGEEIDIVFGGSAGGFFSDDYRIHGIVVNDTFGVSATLSGEDFGTTEVLVKERYVVPSTRFGLAIGRDPDHGDDVAQTQMNLEYIVLRLSDGS